MGKALLISKGVYFLKLTLENELLIINLKNTFFIKQE